MVFSIKTDMEISLLNKIYWMIIEKLASHNCSANKSLYLELKCVNINDSWTHNIWDLTLRKVSLICEYSQPQVQKKELQLLLLGFNSKLNVISLYFIRYQQKDKQQAAAFSSYRVSLKRVTCCTLFLITFNISLM